MQPILVFVIIYVFVDRTCYKIEMGNANHSVNPNCTGNNPAMD